MLMYVFCCIMDIVTGIENASLNVSVTVKKVNENFSNVVRLHNI